MERRTLGRSGLTVSRLGLGTLTWNRDTPADEAGSLLDTFLSAGGSLIDTAASYSGGGAETLLGSLVSSMGVRDDIEIVTKAGIRRTEAGGVVDCSRANMLKQLDQSLTRLGTDHVDVWLAHAYDPNTPLDETLSALEYAVMSGKARYAGLSNYPGWATGYAAAADTRKTLVATQVEYSLLARTAEREVIPAAHATGLGVMAWSPVGRGVLTGKYRHAIPADSRAASDHLAGFVEPYLTPGATSVVDALITAARGLERSPGEVALSWVRDQPGVATAIVGARTVAQLQDSLASESLTLPTAIRDALADVSRVAGN